MARFIKFASYNLHGLQQGKSQLLELCDSHDVIAIQEHWLPDYDFDKILNLHNDFTVVAKSAMTEKIQSGFLRGRPFGGVAILARKSVISNIRMVGVDSKSRCLAVMITFFGNYKILLVNVYLPCSDSSQEYQSALLECFGFIENCIVCNDSDAVMILGDFNFECDNRHVGYKLFENLCDEYKLMCCDSCARLDIPYTYFHNSLGRYSTIDHIFVDRGLFANVIKYETADSGVNLSDHVPVSCTLALPLNTESRSGPRSGNNRRNLVNNVLRWDKGDTAMYYDITGKLLQGLHVPFELLTKKCDGHMCCHEADINCFYREMINTMQYAAKRSIPLVRCDAFKPYWNAELQQLKEDSVQAHLAWIATGRPRQGWMNKFRLHCKYKYKIAIKNAALAFEWDVDDELSQYYLQKDMDKFWKKWQSRFSKKNVVPTQIGGYTDDQDIANCFKQTFSDCCFDSYSDNKNVSELFMKMSYVNDDTELHNNTFNVLDVEKALGKLKIGKAPGFDGVVKEHLIYSHPCLTVYLTLLFNMMIQHSFVPDDFGIGVIIPIIKDRLGDTSDVTNYRGITLSPVVSKLFEYCAMEKYYEYFPTNDLQFGFKEKIGCSHAIFALRQCAEYFVSRGSPIFMAALDAKKAFDRLNHVKLFHQMCDAGIPLCFVKLLINWYSKISVFIKWNNCYSAHCVLKSGVRQGGVLSPVLFNIYISSVIKSLELSDLGCHIQGVYIGCLVYADDIILLSASVHSLQKMLDICYVSGSEMDIVFNAKKSTLFAVGKYCDTTVEDLNIGDDTISWSDRLKYLGVYFKAGHTLLIDSEVTMRKFYAAANAIYSHAKFASEVTVLFLMETFCFPLLSYASEALSYTKKQLTQLNVCWNRAYRKAFHMNDWDSVKGLQMLCGRLDFMHIYDERKLVFWCRISSLTNVVIQACYNNFSRTREFTSLAHKYDVIIGECAANSIREKMFTNFNTTDVLH